MTTFLAGAILFIFRCTLFGWRGVFILEQWGRAGAAIGDILPPIRLGFILVLFFLGMLDIKDLGHTNQR